jgi:hypothetical protein
VTLNAQHRLRAQVGTSGLDTYAWGRGADSPLDSNHRRLHAVVGVDPNPNDTQYSYLSFYSRKGLALDRAGANVRNLSFDFDESTHVGAGAPRISIEFANGDIAYLAAFYCNHPLVLGNGAWGRADFTGFTSNCAIWDNHGVEYSADGTNTAWQVYLTAHPDAVVNKAYIVLDEEGTYNLDRITFGAGDMYITPAAFGPCRGHSPRERTRRRS